MNSSPFLSRLNFLAFHLQPPHCHFPTSALTRYCTQSRLCRSIPRADRYKGSRDRRRIHKGSDYSLPGTSPVGLAESSSLSLRTAISPQIAPHLSSRKRSYHCRIQGGNVTLTGTSTLLFKRLQRRTRTIVSIVQYIVGTKQKQTIETIVLLSDNCSTLRQLFLGA